MNRTMKLLLTLVLALLLAVPAMAKGFSAVDYQGPLPLYVNHSTLNVHKEPDKDSKVIKTLDGAEEVTAEMVSTDGEWTGILVEDTRHGGQRIGWVLSKYLTDSFPASLCRHKEWTKWKVDTEPTCTRTGHRTRYCKACGIMDEEEIPKIAHEWSKWKVTKEATCAKKGERTRTCAACGKTETEEFLDEHTFGAWELTKEATCTEKGERKHTCKVCGTVEKQALDMLPHDYEYRITTEATDHSAGVRAKICKACGKNGGEESFDPEGTIRRGAKGEAVRAMQQLLVEQGYLNADGIGWPQTLKDLEHDFGPWETVKQMSRVEPGERVRVCRGCGFEQREITEPGTVFEKGRRGEDIRALQQIIKQVGYDAGGFDGIYGKKLDAALAGFAADNGLVVEEGKVRPADVDAVVHAWFDAVPAENWKGEGAADSPVNLALTVTEEETDDSGVTTYSWSLTNLGTQKATFTALLLTFGEADFTQEDLVMALDGVELKGGAGNSTSGSFNVAADWGEGDMNFAAMAISESDGAMWLSNTVTYANETVPANKTVMPMDVVVDVNNLPDGIYPVSFDKGDVLGGASGVFMNAVHIYTRDWYDIVDVNTLSAGDTIVVSGEEVPVQSVESTEYGFLVNDGLEDDSFYLSGEEDSNGFAVHGLDDMTTYTDHGVTTLVLDPAATFTDGWDIESDPVTVEADGIVEAIQTSENDWFGPYNTTVRIEGGKVVEINRVYVP